MQTVWLHRQDCRKLILFFAGWGSGPEPFTAFGSKEYDVLMCFDYRSVPPVFDWAEFAAPYAGIVLVAWSFGAVVANRLMAPFASQLSGAVAINGTLSPVDDIMGIPTKVFHGTLRNLSEANIKKFNRRMFNHAGHRVRYETALPQRGVDELTDELHRLGIMAEPAENQVFRSAMVGTDDLIFPAANQQSAWTGRVQFVMVPWGHFPFYGFGTWDDLLNVNP
ncbi:MAG: alpha/beta fold hydrolase [Breznakibacter sp.]